MEQTKPVMVVGATGFLGTEICRQLKAANKEIKALVRTTSDPEKVKALQDMGIQTALGDIKDTSSLEQAFTGVGAVISTVSSTLSRQEGDSIDTVDRQGQLNVVSAAEAAGVEPFIFISFLQSPEAFPLQDAKHAVEERLRQSNMTYTILRPTFFMEIWLSPPLGFDPANAKATIYGQGINKISWISLRDVAAFAVAALNNESARNSIINLGGREALSPLEVVHLFEQQTGKPFQLQYVPEEALRAQKKSATDSLQQSFAALMLTYAHGAEVPMEETLNAFSLSPLTVTQYSHVLLGEQAAMV
jgi:uncharacterized protein YbjT (DUF2867 family)